MWGRNLSRPAEKGGLILRVRKTLSNILDGAFCEKNKRLKANISGKGTITYA